MTVHDDDDDDDNSSEDDIQSVRQSLNCSTNKPTNRHDFRGCCEPHWVIPEKIHTSPTDGILEILTGGGVKHSGNPGGRGG